MADRTDRLASPITSKDRLNELVKAVSTKTNLSDSTVRELLRSDWRFVQELGKPDRWIKIF